MGPQSRIFGGSAGGSELSKSITFHDFCELTQREMGQLKLSSRGRIEEEEEEEEEMDEEEQQGEEERVAIHTNRVPTAKMPKSAPITAIPRWHSLSMDDQDDKGTATERAPTKRRKRPLNATFSDWLQLFLSKRRPRHKCYFNFAAATGANRSRTMHQMHQSCYAGVAGPNGGPLRPSVSLSVVHESSALGSDGESIEVSPCTSDQSAGGGDGNLGEGRQTTKTEYIPKVKLRQKPNRRWSEQDIQKRLSLPPDIRLPQNVIDKLNRTPTLDNPLTRKSKRASLNEIGFGKLETYKKIFDLGEGTYATVYLGKSLLTGKNVALKEIRLEHEEGAPCTAIREVSLLRNLRHANIVTLHDIVYTDRILTLVFEFVERDLREYMEELDGMISIANVKLFLVQLLRGLAYCHCRRILHRDLKPQNLLINRTGELKLADFGLARAQSVPTKTYSNEVVTLWYRPPDVLLGSTDYSTHIDLWGVGCILYEMLLHKPMFPGSTTDEQLNLIFQKLGTPSPAVHADICALQAFKNGQFRQHNAKPLLNPPRISPERADLLSKLLKYEGKYRISATDAMRHPMLNCFPAQLFSLPDTESVLSLPGVHYTRDSKDEAYIETRKSSERTEKPMGQRTRTAIQ
ncbi:hypothetical protein niasHT_035001 [Heterodera trifolii]|uniref:cyclin-dependent kinase n=1 Tax=Heterodera trifolii TaxID=157864 RepID=A0ABD2ICK2_9BILA